MLMFKAGEEGLVNILDFDSKEEGNNFLQTVCISDPTKSIPTTQQDQREDENEVPDAEGAGQRKRISPPAVSWA